MNNFYKNIYEPFESIEEKKNEEKIENLKFSFNEKNIDYSLNTKNETANPLYFNKENFNFIDICKFDNNNNGNNFNEITENIKTENNIFDKHNETTFSSYNSKNDVINFEECEDENDDFFKIDKNNFFDFKFNKSYNISDDMNKQNNINEKKEINEIINEKEKDIKENLKEIDSKENLKEIEIKENLKEIDIKENLKEIDIKENLKEIDIKENLKEIDIKENLKEIDIKEILNEIEIKENLNKIDIKKNLKEIEIKENLNEKEKNIFKLEKKKNDKEHVNILREETKYNIESNNFILSNNCSNFDEFNFNEKNDTGNCNYIAVNIQEKNNKHSHCKNNDNKLNNEQLKELIRKSTLVCENSEKDFIINEKKEIKKNENIYLDENTNELKCKNNFEINLKKENIILKVNDNNNSFEKYLCFKNMDEKIIRENNQENTKTFVNDYTKNKILGNREQINNFNKINDFNYKKKKCSFECNLNEDENNKEFKISKDKNDVFDNCIFNEKGIEMENGECTNAIRYNNFKNIKMDEIENIKYKKKKINEIKNNEKEEFYLKNEKQKNMENEENKKDNSNKKIDKIKNKEKETCYLTIEQINELENYKENCFFNEIKISKQENNDKNIVDKNSFENFKKQSIKKKYTESEKNIKNLNYITNMNSNENNNEKLNNFNNSNINTINKLNKYTNIENIKNLKNSKKYNKKESEINLFDNHIIVEESKKNVLSNDIHNKTIHLQNHKMNFSKNKNINNIKKFKFDLNSFKFLKAFNFLPNLNFLKCNQLKPNLRFFNIVLKIISLEYINNKFIYFLSGDETGCIFLKLDKKYHEICKEGENYILFNSNVIFEDGYIFLNINIYGNLYPLEYSVIENVDTNINYSEVNFINLYKFKVFFY